MPLGPLSVAQVLAPESQRMALLRKVLSRNFMVLFLLGYLVMGALAGGMREESHVQDAVKQWYFTRMDYVVFLVLVVFAQRFKQTGLYWIAKPLPMLLLVYRALNAALTPASTAVLIGLVCGVVGDMILILDTRRYRWSLTVGAMAFFFGHLSYVAAYVLCPLSAGKEVWVVWIGLFLVFMHEYYYFMLKHAPTVEFVFGLVYWSTISVMFMASVNADLYLYHLNHGFLPFAFAGSFLFLLSDPVHPLGCVRRSRQPLC